MIIQLRLRWKHWSYVSTIFKDNSADKLHSGTYFYQLEVGDMRVVKRMFVIK